MTSAPAVVDQRLERLRAIADAIDSRVLRAEVDAVGARLAAGQYYVTCMGALKRGKSTLLNALVGREVLPAGIVPVTAVPTVLRHGDVPALRVRLLDGDVRPAPLGALADFVDEARNPRNRRRVAVVEIALPSALLATGLCLVDTPGVGSVIEESTVVTHGFVPQSDAALLVIGADPPLTGDELRVARALAAPAREVIVVLAKADRYTDDERRAAVRYARTVLAEGVGRDPGDILEVSAAERLRGDEAERDWPRLTHALATLPERAGRTLAHHARERAVARLTTLALREIGERSAALFRPVEESERRVEAVRIFEGDMAHDSLLLGFAMEREQDRLRRDAAARAAAFVRDALPEARRALERAVHAAPARTLAALRRVADDRADAAADRAMADWLAAEHARNADAFDAATERFVGQARAMLARRPHERACLDLGDLAAAVPDPGELASPGAPEGDAALTVPPAARAPVGRARLAALLPALVTRRAALRDAARHLEDRMRVRAAEPGEALDRRLGAAVTELHARVRAVLAGVYETADHAAEAARRLRQDGEPARRREASRLAGLRREVMALAGNTSRGEPHVP